MEIATRVIRGVLVVRPAGRLDPAAAGPFQDALARPLAEGQRWIAIDLTHTEQIAKAGILVLLRLRAKLTPPAGGLVLCGLREPVRRAFDVAGITGKFTTVRSVREAIRRLQRFEAVGRLADRAAFLLAEAETRDLALAGAGRPGVEA
jgi:anti-anti-sigma factor